ncbi:asparagine synthase (glutamine-hydrolyzing) [Azospirillum humicireducens]|uniref:asparagine synthase (glutamine-hydrolyzing) n=1 Tax=Azospirillum humicireducens TaxID=1226968 RepID=UPI001F0067BC|nr:asparagine synthase (glutamine-hydrolyzing) [Azospirillum humicireducens]
MCGVVALINLAGRSVSPDVVQAMTRALAHRGPNAEGVWCDGEIGLGHRRLSILDLSPRANQPLHSTDGELVVSYNGEIYNFQELRRLLEEEGAIFTTNTDTEVLLWGYRFWGIEPLMRRINGMAALAIVDRRRRRMILARDRYGIKPLYLWRHGSTLAAASEIKAFMAHPDFRVTLNQEALNEYFTFQNLFRQHTLFQGVDMLPAGTIMEIEANGHDRQYQYWDFDFSKPDNRMEAAAAAEETRRHLQQAVERQLLSDVPVGAYLSGGIDSGALVAIASQHVPRLATFTAGFEMSSVEGIEKTFDERRNAELMAHACQTEHYEQVMNAGDIRWALPRVVWHLEDLRLGMCYPNYYIARLASKFVGGCLSGAGGDELFGGYPWRYFRVLNPANEKFYLRSYYEFWQRLMLQSERQSMFQSGSFRDAASKDMLEVFSGVFPDTGHLSLLTPEEQISNTFYFECKTFLSGLLIVNDKLSMASGLEERVPFLDNDLVSLAQKIPVHLKLPDLEQFRFIDEDLFSKRILAQNTYNTGKSVLRSALQGFLPTEVVSRPKQGFSAPDGSWYQGENASYVRNFLLSEKLIMSDFIRPDFVRRIVDEHTGRIANHRLLIWSFLCFEWWCRIFLNGERPVS